MKLQANKLVVELFIVQGWKKHEWKEEVIKGQWALKYSWYDKQFKNWSTKDLVQFERILYSCLAIF